MNAIPNRRRSWCSVGGVLWVGLAVLLIAGCRPTPPPPTATPTSVPKPTPKTGPATLRIDVLPVGAQVKVDGLSVGHSPLTLTLEAGSYAIVIEDDGYETIQQSMDLEVGGEAMVAGRLRDIDPPTIEIPLLESPIVLGTSFEIVIQANDNAGVALLSLLKDGSVMEEVAGEGHDSLQLGSLWTPNEPGEYVFTAIAEDSRGLHAEAEFTVSVILAPTATTVATATPTRVVTATPPEPTSTTVAPAIVTAEVSSDGLNLRSGPSLAYPPLGVLERGRKLTVTARDEEGAWLRVCCVDGKEGWLSRYYVVLEGPASELPIAKEDPRPITVPQAAGPSAVTIGEEMVSLPTYPYAEHLTQHVDMAHGGIPVWTFDRASYEASAPVAQLVEYRLIVLENEYLRLTLLPELGGRVYECVFKPTGHNMFYKNPVVKPTRWGPSTFDGANWWLAVGGLEWGLPVEEHGYEWGIPWSYRAHALPDGGGVVDLWDSDEDRLRTNVRVTLEPGQAAFGVHITLTNAGLTKTQYQFWSNAMLAPGAANTVSDGLQFIFPSTEMVVHSTGDSRMPDPWETFSWPTHGGRDVSRVSNWHEYLGFFVHPFADVGYAAVYDHRDGEGLVHVFPSEIVRGSKGFAFGWGDKAISSDNWTDDGSSYAELHTGVTARFDQWSEIDSGASLNWSETWYPVVGLGGVNQANETGAIALEWVDGELQIRAHVVHRFEGTIEVSVNGGGWHVSPVASVPEQPIVVSVPLDNLEGTETIGVALVADGSVGPSIAVRVSVEVLRR